VLALGPALTGAAILLYGMAWLYTASQEAEYPPHWAIVVVLEVALLALAWSWVTVLAEPATKDWWLAPFDWRVDHVNHWWRVAFVLFAVGWLAVRRHVSFRLQYEVSDSSYPGPIGMREGWQGPVGPNTEFLPPPTAAVVTPAPPASDIARPFFTSNRLPTAIELPDYEPPPVREMVGLEMFLILASRCRTLARDTLVGRTLPNGTRQKKGEWEGCIGDLEQHNYVANTGGGWAFRPGTSAEDALRHFYRPTPVVPGNGRGDVDGRDRTNGAGGVDGLT